MPPYVGTFRRVKTSTTLIRLFVRVCKISKLA